MASGSASAPRTRSTTAKNDAATTLLWLSRAGFLPDPLTAPIKPPLGLPRQSTRDALNTRFSQPPSYFEQHNPNVDWANVSPGKRIVAHIADWVVMRFGKHSQIAEDIWRLLPFIREPPGFSECPPGWEVGIDSMGRKHYKNRFTGAVQLSRPQPEQWTFEEDGSESEEEAAAPAAGTQTTTEDDPEWRPWAEVHLGHSPQRAAPVTRREGPVTRSRSQTPLAPSRQNGPVTRSRSQTPVPRQRRRSTRLAAKQEEQRV